MVVWKRTHTFTTTPGIVCCHLLPPSPPFLEEGNLAIVNPSSNCRLGWEAGSEFVAGEGLLVLPQR